MRLHDEQLADANETASVSHASAFDDSMPPDGHDDAASGTQTSTEVLVKRRGRRRDRRSAATKSSGASTSSSAVSRDASKGALAASPPRLDPVAISERSEEPLAAESNDSPVPEEPSPRVSQGPRRRRVSQKISIL